MLATFVVALARTPAAAQSPPASRPPPQAPPPSDGATPAPTEGSTRWQLIGDLKLRPRGFIIVNVAHNRGALAPGNYALLAAPPALSKPQFFVSPANSVLGFELSGLHFAGAELSGAVDVNLRTTTPLSGISNVIAPQFYDLHLQLAYDHLRLIVGQYPDVLLPFLPDTVNSFPSGYVPGALGYFRPQLRGDERIPIGERYQIIIKASVGQPIATFQVGQEAAVRQAGVPDLQGRISFAVGQAPEPWERPFEIGFGGLLGRRRVTIIEPLANMSFRVWAQAADLRAKLPTGTLIKARVWRGSVLADYSAAIFQSVNVPTMQAVHAQGLWFELQQSFSERLKATVGYGWDDPRNADLSPANITEAAPLPTGRSLNEAGFLNLFWDVSKKLGFGLELSRWATRYVGAGTNRVWRADSVLFLRF